MARLGDICFLITDGSHNPPAGVVNSNYKMLSSKNIDDDEITFDDPRYLSEEDFIVEDKRTNVSEGDLLMTIVGTVGRVAVVPESMDKFCLQRSVAVLKPKHDIISSRFLMYQLQSMRTFIEQESRGVAQKGIYLKQISNLSIMVPPIKKQQVIVDILDKLTHLISLRKQQLAKLDELVKARFVEMFGEGFNMASLNSVCSFIDYRGKTPEKSDSGIPLITAKNVRENSFSVEPKEFIPVDNYESVMTRGIPKVNDVLFTTEAPLGNVCRIPNIYQRFCVGQRIITMQPYHDIVTAEYLEFALRDKKFQDKMWEKSSGSTVKGIRSKLLEWLTIPVPPYSLQCSFSDFVWKIDKQRLTIQRSLAKLEMLKKSLMQEYFG